MPINLIIRNPLDRDAREFIQRAGVTDAAARTQLNGFVRGVKALGLWTNMVCWPLRSSQNAGTGTTAFSLGGLGTFNGTLVNGPTWGADGVTLNGIDQNITAQPSPDTNSQFFGLVHNDTTNINTAAASVSTSLVTQTELRLRPNGDLQQHSAGQWLSGVSGSFSRSGFSFYLAAWDSAASQFSVQQNATVRAPVSSSYTGTTDNIIRIMSAPATQFTPGTVPFAFFAKQSINSATRIAFFNLYKSTLGTGLGLP